LDKGRNVLSIFSVFEGSMFFKKWKIYEFLKIL
jgi:hypothetical protein